MSDFINMLCNMLPINSNIQKRDNQLRKVLDNTLGEYMDNQSDIFSELFLTDATGGWLDAFGKDYGVSRKIDESDEDYRKRILMEKLEYLTPEYLKTIFDIDLYAYINQFDASENCLTSDNVYLASRFMSIVSFDIQNAVNKKFILDNSILWVNEDKLDFLIFYDVGNLLLEFVQVYTLNSLSHFFDGRTNLLKVRLTLPNAKNCRYMFSNCGNLQEIYLYIPNLETNTKIFDNCLALQTIDVTIPDSKVNGFKNYVSSLNLENLTSFKINGVEQL